MKVYRKQYRSSWFVDYNFNFKYIAKILQNYFTKLFKIQKLRIVSILKNIQMQKTNFLSLSNYYTYPKTWQKSQHVVRLARLVRLAYSISGSPTWSFRRSLLHHFFSSALSTLASLLNSSFTFGKSSLCSSSGIVDENDEALFSHLVNRRSSL